MVTVCDTQLIQYETLNGRKKQITKSKLQECFERDLQSHESTLTLCDVTTNNTS